MYILHSDHTYKRKAIAAYSLSWSCTQLSYIFEKERSDRFNPESERISVYVGGGRYIKGIFWVFNILICFKCPSLFANVLGTFQFTLNEHFLNGLLL